MIIAVYECWCWRPGTEAPHIFSAWHREFETLGEAEASIGHNDREDYCEVKLYEGKLVGHFPAKVERPEVKP